MNERTDNGRIGSHVTAFAVGAALGAGIALLYAPRSGKDTRKLLARKGKELKRMTSEKIEEAQEFVAGKKAELLGAVEAGRRAIRGNAAKHR